MSGDEVRLAKNNAGVSCTNSLHAVHVTDQFGASRALAGWGSAFTKLSCELEGHPLGGGMLKLEPREASRIVFPECTRIIAQKTAADALAILRAWRHQRDRTELGEITLKARCD